MTTVDPNPIYTELLNERRACGADPALPDGLEPADELPGESPAG